MYWLHAELAIGTRQSTANKPRNACRIACRSGEQCLIDLRNMIHDHVRCKNAFATWSVLGGGDMLHPVERERHLDLVRLKVPMHD